MHNKALELLMEMYFSKKYSKKEMEYFVREGHNKQLPLDWPKLLLDCGAERIIFFRRQKGWKPPHLESQDYFRQIVNLSEDDQTTAPAEWIIDAHNLGGVLHSSGRRTVARVWRVLEDRGPVSPERALELDTIWNNQYNN